MSDPSLWRLWKCSKSVHAQPCWHGRCKCGWATAFDFSREDVERYLTSHDCPLSPGGAPAADDDW